MHSQDNNGATSGPTAWGTTWSLLAPLGIWLLAAKAAALGAAAARYLVGGPGSDTWLGALKWLAHFACVRVGMLALISYVVYRQLFPRRPLLGVATFAGLLLCLAGAVAALKPEYSALGFLREGALLLWDQSTLFAKAAWHEFITISVLALATACLLHVCPQAVRGALVLAIEFAVLLACLVVGLDLVSELAVGQPLNAYVLSFSLSNWQDMLSLVHSETTSFRVAIIVASVALPAWWFWHNRKLIAAVRAARDFRRLSPKWSLAPIALGVVAAFQPTFAIGMIPMQRFAEGTLIAFAKTMASTEAREANRNVDLEFEANGIPRWHSAGLKLVKTDSTRRKNVVVVMMESMRAASTTIHQPSLPTTPFLAALARSSLVVEDMNAVVPRTAGAWVAVLGGQYPLTNEGAARWNIENSKAPRFRGLATALRVNGYATGFFTPANLGFLDDMEVVKALGFETVVGGDELASEQALPVNYMGLSDDVMVDPVLAWTARQVNAGRPFMTAIMTNVGHHPYYLPPTWKKVSFDGVSDPALEAYLNCLLYIDGVVASLMAGYERLGVLNDTVFVLLGDHGQFLGEHGIRQVFNALYQEGLHVPAMIYAPGLPVAPGRVRGPRHQGDILPTIAELLGYRLEGAQLPGKSLLQPVDPSRELFFSSSMESTYLAARRGSRKYVYSFGRSPMEVFDLASDPTEQQPLDVAEDELASMESAMLEWRAAAELSMFARPAAEAHGPWLRR